MAALRPCPSGHGVVAARRLCIGNPSSSLRIAPAALSMQQQQKGSTSLVSHALASRTAPRRRHRHPIGSHKAAADWLLSGADPDDKFMIEELFKRFDEELKKHNELDKEMPFREEIETICEYWKNMTSWKTSIFDMEATFLSLHLCMVATKGVRLASRAMDSAALRLGKQDETYLHTTKQTLTIYVSIFVKLAAETYHKNFNEDSMFSLLGAFRGVAAIGRILVKDAMESLNYVDYGSLSYNFLVQGIDDSWHEFEQNINNLEDKFRAAHKNNSKKYELLGPTMDKAAALTVLFISQMVARHVERC